MVSATEIDNAIISHSLWKDRLSRAVETGVLTVPVEVIADDDRCAFGQWLHGATPEPDGAIASHFTEVKQLHAEFHRLAARIAQLVVDGQRLEARELLRGNREYERLSLCLTRALIAWKESLRRPDPVR